ncbi:MAG: hypothetical protein FWG65_13205 [Turicibacter sp.]|nr:hypothetical protein [Turicibacter sp.]
MDRFLTVKTVVTLALVATLCFMTITERELPNEFVLTLGAVITYFFTKRGEKVDPSASQTVKKTKLTATPAEEEEIPAYPPAGRTGSAWKSREEKKTWDEK